MCRAITRELAEAQARHFGVRFEVVAHEKNLLDLIEARGMFPANKQRYCTSNLKTAQVRKLFTRLADDTRQKEKTGNGFCRARGTAPSSPRRVRILNCMGMRADESPARAKKQPYAIDDGHIGANGKRVPGASNGRREVWNWLPLHAWTDRKSVV